MSLNVSTGIDEATGQLPERVVVDGHACYVRREYGAGLDGRVTVWCADEHDTSHGNANNYDPRCSMCWLGHAHTTAAHFKALA